MNDANQQQKFVILPDGTVDIEWINPAFSDVIIELLPEDRRKSLFELSEKFGTEPKIYCG